MALMQEDLPLPVAPAMSTWGISARLTPTAVPEMSLPRPTIVGLGIFVTSGARRTSPSVTSWRSRLGTSMPIAERPGIGARMRSSPEARA